MARDPSLLSPTVPTAIVPAQIHIGHVQLRDLLICPRETGVINYVQRQSIVEQNLHDTDSPTRTLADLSFTPNTLTSLRIGEHDTLLAAGGQDAEIHLSYHAPTSSRQRRTNLLWQYERQLGGSINNSVVLTSLNLAHSHESSVEPRVGISNNDCTVKFYDVPIRAQNQKRTIKEAGSLRLDVPINHSSISPDGRTLLSVGDSSKVYFHHISGGARLTFSPITTLTIPAPDTSPYPSSSLAASFSTAFSSDGMKFAVASQEGVVAVWDVRSCKPLKVFQTDKMRVPSGSGGASGWLSDDPWEWTRGSSKAPGWSVRNVKFNTGNFGKEVMVFTEHTSLIHLVDARTFETDEVIRVPTVPRRSQPPPPPASRPQQLRPLLQPPQQQQQQQRHFFTSSTSSSRIGSPPSFLVSGPSSPRRPPTITHRDLSIVQALGDAFRIPTSAYSAPSSISDSTWRTVSGLAHRSSASRGGGASARQSEQDLLLIPPLGDRDVESEVHALLEGHGGLQSATRHPGVVNDDEDIEDDFAEDEDDDGDRDTNTGSTHADYEYRIGGGSASLRRNRTSRTRSGGDSQQPQTQAQHFMEVDEIDGNSSAGECISRTPSRSSSPSPSSTLRERSVRRRTSSSSPMSSGDQAKGSFTGEIVYPSGDLDLAGVCFDPYGGRMYVASTEAVVEWGVRGADKCWWFGDGWR